MSYTLPPSLLSGVGQKENPLVSSLNCSLIAGRPALYTAWYSPSALIAALVVSMSAQPYTTSQITVVHSRLPTHTCSYFYRWKALKAASPVTILQLPISSPLQIATFIASLLIAFIVLPDICVVIDTSNQLLLVLEVGVPLLGDHCVGHHLVHTLVLGQQSAVAA